MNAVIGMTGLLLDTELAEEQREFVETVWASGDALLVITNDILDFSEIESDQLDLEQVSFELRECEEGSLDLVAAAATLKGLELVSEVDEGCPQWVTKDPARLRQILVNRTGCGEGSSMGVVRPGPDGHPDAGDGRVRSDPPDTRRRAGAAPAAHRGAGGHPPRAAAGAPAASPPVQAG